LCGALSILYTVALLIANTLQVIHISTARSTVHSMLRNYTEDMQSWTELGKVRYVRGYVCNSKAWRNLAILNSVYTL